MLKTNYFPKLHLCRSKSMHSKLFERSFEVQFIAIKRISCSKLIAIDPTVNTLNRRRGHYNAWKLLTCSFPVRIEMLRLMNKMSARILNFWIGWHKPLKCLNKSWWYLTKHICFIIKLKDFCNTCVHFQWKKTNACWHDRDTVSAAHAWFAWQAPSLGQIAYLR